MDKDLLIRRLEVVIDQLDVMHETVVIQASARGIRPAQVTLPTGEPALVPIFAAQAHALSALAMLYTVSPRNRA